MYVCKYVYILAAAKNQTPERVGIKYKSRTRREFPEFHDFSAEKYQDEYTIPYITIFYIRMYIRSSSVFPDDAINQFALYIISFIKRKRVN